MRQSPFGPYDPAVRGTATTNDVPQLIHEKFPELSEAAWAVTYEQQALVSQVLSDSGTHEPVRLLFSLAVNDFMDLLHDLQEGSGRSATRAARSVIEHAINMHTVTASLENASLYLEHLDQGPALALELKVGEERLDAQTRRVYLRALTKVGAIARTRFEAAVVQHGAWLRRGWTQANLADRSTAHALDHIYRYYKLASLVTHGSAGGSLGTVRLDNAFMRTYRSGPALELAPFAMWAGVAGYREVLAGLSLVRTDIRIDAYIAALDQFDALWARYFAVLKEIDLAMWPDDPVRPPSAVLAFTQTKKRRWYLHLPMSEILLQAQEPTLPDWIEEQVSTTIDAVVREQPWQFRNDQRWVTMSLMHVSVTPDGTGKWIPATALMAVPSEGFEPFPWVPSSPETAE